MSPFMVSVESLSVSKLGFRFFEAKEVNVPTSVAGDDQLESIGECAAMRGAIAGKGNQDFSGFQVPQFHRIVRRRRDRALPVRRHRHRIDSPWVAGEGVQFASAGQIPHLQRLEPVAPGATLQFFQGTMPIREFACPSCGTVTGRILNLGQGRFGSPSLAGPLRS
jgi:hypothetical protein